MDNIIEEAFKEELLITNLSDNILRQMHMTSATATSYYREPLIKMIRQFAHEVINLHS